MAEHKVKLGYWEGYGKAQPARYLLELTETPYEDIKYVEENDWFGRDKFTLGLDFPNLPFVIDGDFKLTEFTAVFDYLSDTYGKAEWRGTGKNVYVVKMLRNLFEGVVSGIYNVDHKSDDQKEKFLDSEVIQKFKFIHDFVGADSKFLLGEFTLADLYFLNAIKYYKASGRSLDLLQPYADKLNRIQANIESIPQILAYINSDRHPK